MTDTPRPVIDKRRSGPAAAFDPRSKRWTNSAARIDPKKSQNARRNYEQYLALARAEALAGNTIGAENYYQYAEHYFRSLSSDQEKEHKSSDQMQLSCSVSHNDAGTAQKDARCLNQLAAMDRP